MTYILQIDTSGEHGTVALTANGSPVAVAINKQSRDHAATIHRMTQEVLDTSGILIERIHAIAVCAGPGSYTGLRIGLAVAKGFCYALGIPLILHNKLMLIAHQVIIREQPKTDILYAVIAKARVGEYFATCYNHLMQPILEPQHMQQDQLHEWLQSVTTDLKIVTDQESPESAFTAAAHINYYLFENINVETWGDLAYKDYKNNKTADLATATPFYMKDVYINKAK